MRNQIALLALAAALSACGPNSETSPLNGVSAVNVPVVSRADYAFDAAAPDGSLASGESARLDAWFRSLQLGYGDAIYVDGSSDAARDDVARVAGQYGLRAADHDPDRSARDLALGDRCAGADQQAVLAGDPSNIVAGCVG